MNFLEQLACKGLVIIPNILSEQEILILREELETAIAEDLTRYNNVFDKGMVHNCMLRGKHMAKILDNPVINKYVNSVLSDTCILYAYQSSSLAPGQGNYGGRIHVDSPRFIPGYITNLGVILPLDNFTEENGATYYLEGSHLSPNAPDTDEFFKKAKRACCNAGDMIVFNPRCFHAAGKNTTDVARHALTLNYCRSYMRQRFDYPRLVPPELMKQFSEDGKRLLGMNVRMPTSLEEFYLPEESRLYKANQG